MYLTQRTINFIMFVFVVGFSFTSGVSAWATGVPNPGALIGPLSGALVTIVLGVSYHFGFDWARYLLVVYVTLTIAFTFPTQPSANLFSSVVVLIPPATALVLTSPRWVFGSGVAIALIFFIRTTGTANAVSLVGLITFLFLIGAFCLSRMAIDSVQRLEAAKREAEEARMLAETERTRAEQQAQALAQRNIEQQRLLELVQTLETSAIQLDDGVLLAPIVGTLDSRRAQALTSHLLDEVNARRASQVILDIAGVTMVDTEVAKALLHTAQSLRLLGCTVAITGLTPSVALTLTQLGVSLEGVTTARSPQEVLARTERQTA
ncbi:MAG: STAS domain-containing protein [Chloroflexaceae bacterium]|jgi:anti-anti-sigma regulatory factor|nr:STAS domain-containing protein [Chloroflexaceae bacterium]